MRLTNVIATAQAQVIVDAIDDGATGGLIKIYSGTQPATADTALSNNTLLAELTFSTSCSSSVTNGVITFAAIASDSNADATGTATFARISDSTGSPAIFDATVGTSDTDIILSSTSISAGDSVAISSFTYTVDKDMQD